MQMLYFAEWLAFATLDPGITGSSADSGEIVFESKLRVIKQSLT